MMRILPNAQMNNPPDTVNGIVGVAAGVKLSEMHAKKPVNNVKPKNFSSSNFIQKYFLAFRISMFSQISNVNRK